MRNAASPDKIPLADASLNRRRFLGLAGGTTLATATVTRWPDPATAESGGSKDLETQAAPVLHAPPTDSPLNEPAFVRIEDYASLRKYDGPGEVVYITDLAGASQQHSISGIFVRDMSDKAGIDNGGTIIVAANGSRWKRTYSGLVNAVWFGAKGNGLHNDAPAIQAALNFGRSVFIPEGRYRLEEAIRVDGGMAIIGDQGRGTGFYSKGHTTLLPKTTAIVTANFNSQLSHFTLRNVGFEGGTVAVDLGLFHETDITDCSFFGFSVGALVIVRGEKHRLNRLRFDATRPKVFALSLGRWEDSTNSKFYNEEFFGSPGAWFDRAEISNVHFQSSLRATFAFGIKANIISCTTMRNLLLHGARGGEVSALFVRDRIQESFINNFAIDTCGSESAPMTSVFDVGQMLNTVFIGLSPQFAGNNFYSRGFNIQSMFGSLIIGSRADGDNIRTFGFYINGAHGQTGTFIGCSGALYHASTNTLVRSQIVTLGCNLKVSNASGVFATSTSGQDLIANLMSDTNGKSATDARWGAQFSDGNGNERIPFYVRRKNVWINDARLAFTNKFGEVQPQTISAGANTPEGKVVASPGSIYLFYSDHGEGGLYVKQSGIGNTGWILK